MILRLPDTTRFRHILLLILLGGLGLRILFGAALIGRVADSYGIVFGLPIEYSSMDSAQALRTVRRSSWWQSNGYRQYGPLYFRTAWTLEKTDPLVGRGSPWRWGDSRGVHYHMSMLLLNWISMFAVCAVLTWPLGRSALERLAGTLLLQTAMLYSGIWCWGVFVAKLEFFLCLLTSLLALWIWRLFPSCGLDARTRRTAAVLFGLVLGTKLVGLVYLLVLPLAFIPWFSRPDADGDVRGLRAWAGCWPLHRRILPGLEFLAIAFAVYLAVGWPQNADYRYLLPYLRVMSHSNEAPPGTMPDMHWWHRLFTQAVPLLVSLSLFTIWSAIRGGTPRRSGWDLLRALLFITLPLMHIFGTRPASPSEHYLMIFICSGLVMVAGVLVSLWPASWRVSPRVHTGLLALLVAVALLAPLVVPTQWSTYTRDLLDAKEASMQRYQVVTALQQAHRNVYVDAYVPHNPNLGRIRWSYKANDGVFTPDGPDVLVLWPEFYMQYLSPEPNFFITSFWWRNRHASAEFYSRFQQPDGVMVDPLGRTWKREIVLDMEIWTLEPIPAS